MRFTVALASLLALTTVPAGTDAALPPEDSPLLGVERPAVEIGDSDGSIQLAKQVRSRGSTSLNRSQSRPSLSRQAPRRIGQNNQPLFKDRNTGVSGPQRVQPLPRQPNR